LKGTESKWDVVIIGAGLTGLSCAVRLHEAGLRVLLLEADRAIGGRVQTDQVEGFLLDRGFQVYLDAYPTAGNLLDLDSLGLGKFEPGALVWKGGEFRRVMDVWRRPKSALTSALQPIGNLFDKLRVARLRYRLRATPIAKLWAKSESTSEQYLADLGFSKGMIDTFFRPFYGGIFLERGLATSSRMFEFTFKMFSEGSATLPASGMQAIPLQLAARLPEGTIRLETAVLGLRAGAVELARGEAIPADHIVVATDGDQAATWLGAEVKAPKWQSVLGLYFDAPASPLGEPIIALNGDGQGLVNNVSVPSDVSPHYAPAGRSLVSVSVLGSPDESNLEARVKSELTTWFGPEVADWRHLATYRIRKALPAPSPAEDFPGKACQNLGNGLYVAGDHLTCGSIEGAVTSGLETAEAILRKPVF